MRSWALADAAPERFITLTRVGDDWPTIRARMFRLRHRLSEAGCEVEWAWMVEANPRGTGHHVHAWQRGSFVPQRTLAALSRRGGAGVVVDVRAWQSVDQDAISYGLKGLDYGLKGVRDPTVARDWLSANGGRLTHQSRRWWGCLGVRHADRSAWIRRRDDTYLPWEVWRTADLQRALSTAEGRARLIDRVR